MSSWPPIVFIHAGDHTGTGLWVAPEFVLTAWHVVSTDGLHPLDKHAKPEAASQIELHLQGEKLALREGRRVDVRFATRANNGGPLNLDLALLHVPLPAQSQLRDVPPLPLALGLFGVVGDFFIGQGPSTLEFHGFPSSDASAPSQRDFRPTKWAPNTRDDEQERCGLDEPGVEQGYSGGPLLARVGAQRLWIGLVSLGGHKVAHSGFVLAGAIRRFFEATERAGNFHGFKAPAALSLHDALLAEPRGRVVERCERLYWSSSLKLSELYVERVVELSAGRDPTPLGAPLALEQHLLSNQKPDEVAPRFALVADPGAGKSTLLRHLAWKLSKTAASRFALDLRLPSLRDGKWSRAALLAHAQDRCGAYARLLLEHHDPRGQLVLLLDGYDEVDASGEGLEQVDDLLRMLANDLPRTPILLASRPPFYVIDLPSFRCLAAQPLDEHKQRDLLLRLVAKLRPKDAESSRSRRIDAAALERWVSSIQTDSRYTEDRGNPLWLTLAARVVARRDDLPTSRVKLLDNIVADLADGLHSRSTDAKSSNVGDPAPKGWREVLEALARRMTGESRVQLTLSELCEWISSPEDTKWSDVPDFAQRVATLRPAFDSAKFPGVFIAWLGERSILAPTEVESARDDSYRVDEPYAFWHRSIQEFLTACELHRQWSDKRGQERVLALATKAVEEADRALLERLAAAVERIRPLRERLQAQFPIWTRDAFSFESAEERGSDLAKRGRTFIRSWAYGIEDLADQWGLRRARLNAAQLDGERFWGEPLGMLAALVSPSDAEALFESLSNAPSIGVRALQACESATEASVCSVLDELSEEEPRGRVIELIPRLSAAPQNALSLLEALGARPAQRSDLFFIDEALTALAVRHKAIAAQCDKTRKRMYLDLVGLDLTALRADLRWSTVPAGRHRIGEQGKNEVNLDAPLRLGYVTVTRREYRRFDPSYEPWHAPSVAPENPDRLPAYEVSWYAATAYARWLGWVLDGAPGRLPTDVEWEIACRAGSATSWSCGNDERELLSVAHFDKDESDGPFEVGLLHANAWGLSDMHGNVWEWCSDLYERGPGRVLRGGSYWDDADSCRSAYRDWNRPASRDWDLGFRVVLPATPAQASSFDL